MIPTASAYGRTERYIRPVAMTTWIPAAPAACSAAAVRGRSTPSCQVSVRSRSHAIAATSRGNPSGSLSGSPETYAATSAISCLLRLSENEGITPWPLVTRSTTMPESGLASSRLGPTLPVDPAASNVWQPPQPAAAKTLAPFAGSPLRVDSGSVDGSSVVVAVGTRAHDRLGRRRDHLLAAAPGQTERATRAERAERRRDASGQSLTSPARVCTGQARSRSRRPSRARRRACR